MSSSETESCQSTAACRQQPIASERGGIVVLDFGGQYTQLIARRIREQQVFSAILPCNASLAQIRAFEPAGIVLSGGPCSVYDAGAPPAIPRVLSLGVPVLGHLLRTAVDRAHAGRQRRSAPNAASTAPRNWNCATARRSSPGFRERLKIWMSHGDHVLALPPGFQVTGATGNSLSAAEDPARRIFAVQFHPEVRHTERGTEILRNFVFRVCGAQPNWSGASFIAETVEAIRKQVGERAGHLRAQRRRGLGGGGGAGASRHRRPADECFRG